MIALTDCASSMLDAHGYDAASQTLAVRFKGGGKVYHYRDVPPEVAEAMRGSASIGSYFARHVRGKFEHEAIDAEAS